MRIISGKYKHRRVDVPSSFKARPTTDFAKENLFNILHNVYLDFDDEPAALDLFAGTGSISLELLSRGCKPVVSIEKDFRHYQFISRTARDLGDEAWHPLHADVLQLASLRLQRFAPSFQLIFADPPYALPQLDDLPDLVLNSGLLDADGLFILEHGKDHRFDTHPQFLEHREYGSVNFSFFSFNA